MSKKTPAKRDVITADVAELLRMLTYKRPSGGVTEAAFVAQFIAPLGTTPDEYGNHWLTIGVSPILWSCHFDTVHKTEGKQRIEYGDGAVTLAGDADSNCLGADCTAGVWLMVQMARFGVPGTYVFHSDEEIGGLGSSYIAKETPERLAGLTMAIAFDRKGRDEVITHQYGYRCASEAFAASFAQALHPLKYSPSDGGVFTDTENYATIIPECSNLGVGYFHQHTPKEWLDVRHLVALRDKLLSADFSGLVVQRDPAVWDCDDAWPSFYRDKPASGDTYLVDYVRRNPQEVAAFLEDLGYGSEDVERFAYDMPFDLDDFATT